MRSTRALLLLAAVAASSALGASASAAPGPDPVLPHYQVAALPGTIGAAEPRNATAPDGRLYTMTNATDRSAVVLVSTDQGVTWTKTAGNPVNGASPTTDVDIVATRTGRLIGSELDFAGPGAITFVTSYSDDRGATWTRSTGQLPADTDRQWYAVGPDDPTTHQPRVYLLFHNLASGTVSHNMFVSTSTDNGATFGAPVPTTLPGDQAFADLQCADSGGPSNIFVNQTTGQLYVVFGTRTSTVAAAGGCAASVSPGPFEVNVVNATRVWVATSPTGSAGTWRQSLAVDRSEVGHIVGAQLSPGAVDRAGNVYVAFPESANSSDFTSGINYVHAPADLSSWSAPVVVTPLAGAGNIVPDIVAGDAGRVAFSWWHGDDAVGTAAPLWYQHVGESLDALAAAPHVSTARVSDIPVQAGTENVLLGACGTGPAAGVENGTICGRSSDVNGVGIDPAGRLFMSWPAQVPKSSHAATAANDKTYAATAIDGPSLYADPPPKALPEAPAAALVLLSGLAVLGAAVIGRHRRAGSRLA